MEYFILCRSKDGTVLEIEDDGTVGLETNSVLGETATGLTLTPQLVERLVWVLDKKMLEPKDGWGTPERVYCVTFGQERQDSPAEWIDVSSHQASNATLLTPQIGAVFPRRLLIILLLRGRKQEGLVTSEILTPDKMGKAVNLPSPSPSRICEF